MAPRAPVIQPPVIISLCDYSGVWSQPYEEAGYDVRRVDLKDGRDARLYEPPRQREVRGVLAAPPCTVFAGSGARWPRTEEDMLASLEIVAACCRIVCATRPKWWVLENPVGSLYRWLGRPQMVFQPYEYGDPEKKRTCLWGDFTEPRKRPVDPHRGSYRHYHFGGPSEATKAARSETYKGFSRAFFESNR